MKKRLPSVTNQPGIYYSHFENRKLTGAPFIGAHGICQILSGKLLVTDAGQQKLFTAGDLFFFRRNSLAKFIFQNDGLFPFRAITVVFDQETLNQVSRQYNLGYEEPYLIREAILQLESPLLLSPYCQSLETLLQAPLPAQQLSMKKQEGLRLLLQVNPALRNVLFDLDQPAKNDLAAFMLQHFHYNIELTTFAYLSGRSLATFKREFEKIFGTTPTRWLQERRLQEAHYLISEKGKRPMEVVAETGFEKLSLLAAAFKQQYGITPAQLAKRKNKPSTGS